jgi:hypothetical protein
MTRYVVYFSPAGTFATLNWTIGAYINLEDISGLGRPVGWCISWMIIYHVHQPIFASSYQRRPCQRIVRIFHRDRVHCTMYNPPTGGLTFLGPYFELKIYCPARWIRLKVVSFEAQWFSANIARPPSCESPLKFRAPLWLWQFGNQLEWRRWKSSRPV